MYIQIYPLRLTVLGVQLSRLSIVYSSEFLLYLSITEDYRLLNSTATNVFYAACVLSPHTFVGCTVVLGVAMLPVPT